MPHSKPLAGQAALVTGGAMRLGAALAEGLAKAGANVVLHCNRSLPAAEELAEALRTQGAAAAVVQADLRDPAAADALVGEAISRFGSLDILINNASIFDDVAFANMNADNVLENVSVNAVAPMLAARRFAAQGREGVVVNLLDAMTADYDRKHVPYHLSKRMLSDLTRIMALEFAPSVRVNAVAPGLILPPPGKDESYLKELVHSNPLHRYGAPSDIVKAALFLIDASFVTGQILYVDGGRNMRGKMYE